jgi:AraC-like DNA-binding protein
MAPFRSGSPTARHNTSTEWLTCRAGPSGIDFLEAAFDRHIYDRHIHETYAIGFTLRGVQRFWCRGATHDSTPGHVILINPGEVHDGRSGTRGGYAYRMFYVPIDTLSKLVEDGLERRVATIDALESCVSDRLLAQRLNETWDAVASSAPLATEELIHSTFVHIVSRHAGLRPPPRALIDRAAVNRVRDYLHDRVEERVTLGELAVIASMSRFQLTRQFQKAFGLPLRAYHLHVRLAEARRRLRIGHTIARVAADLGFVDQSHLHRRFKGAFGVTPGQYAIGGRSSIAGVDRRPGALSKST